METSLTIFYAVIAFVAFLIGIAKGGFGGLIGGLATPILALVLPVDQVLGLLMPILMLADIFAVAMHWGLWNLKLVVLLLPGAIAGVVIGTLFIRSAPTRVLRITLGTIVLLVALYKLVEKRVARRQTYVHRNWHGLAAGTVTGFASTLAHSGAPPVSVYLLFQQITPQVFVATSVLFFFILNWIKVPFYAASGLFDWGRIWQIVWLFPLVPLGVWFGKWFVSKTDRETFEKVIVVILIILAITLFFD
jgi:hypothetical protein